MEKIMDNKEYIKEVFERYKHLDQCLCDKLLLPDDIRGKILYDLWQAIKKEIAV